MIMTLYLIPLGTVVVGQLHIDDGATTEFQCIVQDYLNMWQAAVFSE